MKAITKNHILACFCIVALAAALYLVASRPDTAQGSVTRNSEYFATSTAPITLYGATITGDRVITDLPGTLGSVVITGANTGAITLYNATTSNVNLRTGQKATSTILLTSLPPSLAAGTYTFDVVFTDGLLLELENGTMPTSTITYRP